MLLSSKIDGQVAENVSVVSIVGMGGLGKTTLAQLVYNGDSVKDQFVLRGWVCVSDSFDVVKLTKEILEEITGQITELEELNSLQISLQKELEGKRFLLVLDDLRNENLEHWRALWRPLRCGTEGSRVLVTTRNENVSRISGAIRFHSLKGLCGDDRWSLFAQCAFGGKNPDDHPKLVSIGKEIVAKCGGLPLAIKTLGSFLSRRRDVDSWNDILRSEIWASPAERKDNILAVLKLSYDHLPSPVKPCFAFCAMFPKDHIFAMKELVLFWMAHGYIKPGAIKSMEDIGEEYFDDLVMRSFFLLDTNLSGNPVFKMHDLIHDLAVSICDSECCTFEDGMLCGAPPRKVRHLSFKCEADIRALLSCGSTHILQHLRTCYLLPDGGRHPNVFTWEVINEMFRRMKYLRAVDLRNARLSELPDSVCNLKHLRYLRIGKLDSATLPEALGNLVNLQILQVDKCAFEELPRRWNNLFRVGGVVLW